VKLAEWARANGVHPKTAYRWWREGILPGPARKVGPRTILVDTAAGDSAAAAGLYARVSSHDQAEDLEPQVARISGWAAKPCAAPSRTWGRWRCRIWMPR